MPDDNQYDLNNTPGPVKRLTLPDGFRVGIKNLDNILREVASLNLTDTQTIKAELLNRVKIYNYVASSAGDEYSVALFQEYQRKWGKSEETKDRSQSRKRKLPGG